jgi:hypothetical protein
MGETSLSLRNSPLVAGSSRVSVFGATPQDERLMRFTVSNASLNIISFSTYVVAMNTKGHECLSLHWIASQNRMTSQSAIEQQRVGR